MTPQEQYPELLTIDDVLKAMAVVKSKTSYGWQYDRLEIELRALIKQRKAVAPAPAQGVEEDCEYARAWEDYSRGVEEGSQGREKADKYDFRAGWIAGSRWQQGQGDSAKNAHTSHTSPVIVGWDDNKAKEAIENALYATGRFLTDVASELADGIIGYLNDAGVTAPAIGARWVRASERLPEVGTTICFRIFERRYSGEYIGNRVFKSHAHACTYGAGSVEWLDESPCTFPTREQAVQWAKGYKRLNGQKGAMLAMYDWIVQQLKQN